MTGYTKRRSQKLLTPDFLRGYRLQLSWFAKPRWVLPPFPLQGSSAASERNSLGWALDLISEK